MEDEIRELFNDMLRDLRMCFCFKIKFLIILRWFDNVLVLDLRFKYVELDFLGGKESIEVLKGGVKIFLDNFFKVEV